MASHFLTKTQIALENCLRLGEDTVLERHAGLSALLQQRVGGQTASLFAEPLLSRGNDSAPASVSWYSEHDGKPRPLTALPIGARGAIESYLSDNLAPLRALLDDPEVALLLGAALWQMDPNDVVVVNSRPILINWGMRPARLGADTSALAAHYGATLGRFLPLATPPGLPPAAGRGSGAAPAGLAMATGAVAAGTAATAAAASPEAGAVTGPETPPPGGGAAAAAPPAGATPPPPPPAAAASALPAAAWIPLVVLLVLASVVLLWLLLPGTRLFAENRVVPAVTDESAVALAEQVNRDLAARRAALEAALAGATCRPDGTLVIPDGRTPDGLLPPATAPGAEPAPGDAPGDRTEAAPDALLPTNPARVQVPETGASGELETASLLDVIESRTVLVLAKTGNRLSNGSGFVVGPGLIMTNHHVIADAAQGGGTIAVAHQRFPQPVPAQVLRMQGPLEAQGGDYALLRIADTSLPAFEVHLSQSTLKLTNVIAAGFPGDVLATDSGFDRLLRGTPGAMPQLTVTDGAVSTEQALASATNVLVHSAPLSKGNSGGPLVDLCGRVVGINTFVRAGDLRTLNFALASGDILGFLDGTPAAPAVVAERCAPVVTRPAPELAEVAPAPDAAPAATPAGTPQGN